MCNRTMIAIKSNEIHFAVTVIFVPQQTTAYRMYCFYVQLFGYEIFSGCISFAIPSASCNGRKTVHMRAFKHTYTKQMILNLRIRQKSTHKHRQCGSPRLIESEKWRTSSESLMIERRNIGNNYKANWQIKKPSRRINTLFTIYNEEMHSIQ